MSRGFESTNGRYVKVGDQRARDRKRRRCCPDDRVELEQREGWLYCPTCGKTADELAQVTQ
jgi:uncharacterized Zn finger protein (UPF0148 family)